MSKKPSMTEEMASSFKVGKELHEASGYNAEGQQDGRMEGVRKIRKTDNLVMLSARIPVELKRNLDVWCKMNGVSVQEVVRIQLEKFMAGKIIPNF
jgi:hypothetical protein